MRPLCVYHLGRVEYEDGLVLQARVAEAVRQKRLPDTLLLLEHPPVITLGRAAKRQHLLGDERQLAEEGIEVHQTDRGGDVTYHGPGQLVGYPILSLSPDRQDVRKYVRNLEESLIQVLARWNLHASRIPQWTGVWLGTKDAGDARKIAAIGVHLSRWLTTHGFALNVSTHLAHFNFIVPCGISGAGVTSMAQELGHPIALAQIEKEMVESFSAVFDYRPQSAGGTLLRTVSVAVLRPSPHGPDVLLLRRTEARGGFWQTVTGRIENDEQPAQAAARELQEETGQSLEVRDLGYRHRFALGSTLPPELVEESAFAACWPEGAVPRLDAKEHEALDWVSVDEALRRVPYIGLKRGIVEAARLGAAGLWGRTPVDQR